MSNSKPQNLQNHARFDPPFHFFLAWVFLANVVVSIVYAAHHLCFYSAWLVVLSIAALIAVFRIRIYPLKVQDRVIRLEERLPPRSGTRRSIGSPKTSWSRCALPPMTKWWSSPSRPSNTT